MFVGAAQSLLHERLELTFVAGVRQIAAIIAGVGSVLIVENGMHVFRADAVMRAHGISEFEAQSMLLQQQHLERSGGKRSSGEWGRRRGRWMRGWRVGIHRRTSRKGEGGRSGWIGRCSRNAHMQLIDRTLLLLLVVLVVVRL